MIDLILSAIVGGFVAGVATSIVMNYQHSARIASLETQVRSIRAGDQAARRQTSLTGNPAVDKLIMVALEHPEVVQGLLGAKKSEPEFIG